MRIRLFLIISMVALIGCNLSVSLTPPPPTDSSPSTAAKNSAPATYTPIPPSPTHITSPTKISTAPSPIPVETLAAQVLDQLLKNETALIDALGRDFAEQRIINVYKRVSPSVVNITTQVLRQSFYFETVPLEGAGSGFVLDSEGHIVTNYHVIKNAQQIDVTFIDETTISATVVGSDPRNDIAILKVNSPDNLLVPIELGDSDKLQVGQRTVVIGNPFGQFGGTLTAGVVSALRRSIEGQDGRQISGIIQTDAAINSGNSGGPLLDSAGRVIGINTAIFSPSGTNAGVGFSIPINTLKRVLPDLLELGRYRHPWLGVRYAYRVTPGLAELLDLPVDKGLLLVDIHPDSPLNQNKVKGRQEEAFIGTQRIYIGGDILVTVNQYEITSLDSLQILLENQHKVGDEVTVAIIRNGQKETFTMQLAEEPPQ